jgi:hypothetical protein
MKTVKKDKKIARASDDAAREMVKTKGWKYCSKSEWREKVRDAKPVETKKKVKKKSLKKRDLKKLFGIPHPSNQCDAKYVENPKATAFRDKVLGKKKFIKVDDAGVDLKTGKFNG